MSITLNEDGTITRDNDGKLLAIASDGVVEWEHHMLKKKHEKEVLELLGTAPGDDTDKESEGETEDKAPPTAPAPEQSPSLGDLTPGYPEWYLEANGQEAWNEKYQVKGITRYTIL